MAQTLKQKIFSGVFWQGLNTAGNYFIGFVISIILARLLTPDDFGAVAIVEVFIVLCGAFIDSGFSVAIIQKKDLKPEDCSSVFFLNLFMAGFFYALLWIASPWISAFYERPELTLCIRVLGITMIIRSFAIVQNALILKGMRFKQLMRISLTALVVSGCLGVWLAFKGYGVWAWIFQQLCSGMVSCILFWVWGRWRPGFVINFARLKELFNFGWKMLSAGLLAIVVNNIVTLLFGKLFNFATLSYYRRGNHTPSLGMNIVNSAVGDVLLSAFADIQQEKENMIRLMRKALQNMMFLVTPVMVLIAVTAKPLVLILYGENWLPAVPYVRIFCCFFVFSPIQTIFSKMFIAGGRSDFLLLSEFLKHVQLLAIIILTFRYGPITLASGMVIINILHIAEVWWMRNRMYRYSIWQHIIDIFPVPAIALLAGGSAWIAVVSFPGKWLQMLCGSLSFGAVYIVASLLFKQIPDDIAVLAKKKLPFLKGKL